MDTNTLVDRLLEDGRKLVEELPRQGFAAPAAVWLKTSDDGKWRFMIVSPLVESEGILNAYKQLHPLVRNMPSPFSIDPLEIKLVGPSNPIARDLLSIHSRHPWIGSFPMRWKDATIGNVSIEAAYVYAPFGNRSESDKSHV